MERLTRTAPAVFAVGEDYQIMVEVTAPALMWVEVDGEEYFDESNGIVRSSVTTHRMTVPMEALDRAGKYSVCYRKIIDRKPYFAETEDVVREDFGFHPVRKGKAIAFQIADAHNMTDAPIAACREFEKKFGDIDFLILNGDVIDHSGRIENFHNIYVICDALTGGTKPVIFSRGNHDLRGFFAENFAEHTPVMNGNTFYSFTLGDIAGIVLDCGEDKTDDHAEYGHTVACHGFRLRETRWLEKTLDGGFGEGAAHRVVICHVPFTWKIGGIFDIEPEIYSGWAKTLAGSFRPELMITGHMHELYTAEPGDERERFRSPCAVVTGSLPKREGHDYFAGSGFIFDKDGIKTVFCDSEGKVLD